MNKEYDENAKIKTYITEEKRLTGRYAGVRILATNFDDAEQKLKIHNDNSIYKTKLIGQLIKETG